MNISQKYLEELPLNFLDAAQKVIGDALRVLKSTNKDFNVKFRELIPLYSLLLELKGKLNNAIIINDLNFDSNIPGNIALLNGYIGEYGNQVKTEVDKRMVSEEIESIESTRESFRAHLGEEFSYSLSEEEIEQIQKKINQLREFISKCKVISADHKVRLFKRLEKLQAELHKKMSNLDRFWGLIGEAGIVLGKFGKDTRPLVENIKDIANIIWRAQTRSESIGYQPIQKLLDKLEDNE